MRSGPMLVHYYLGLSIVTALLALIGIALVGGHWTFLLALFAALIGLFVCLAVFLAPLFRPLFRPVFVDAVDQDAYRRFLRANPEARYLSAREQQAKWEAYRAGQVEAAAADA